MQRVAALADPRPGELLVDLGTGTGLVLKAVLAQGGRPTAVHAVDPSAAMLGQVGPLPDGWATEQRPAQDTGLRKGAADVVTCAYVLHVLDADARAAVLREARRVLRRGGRFVCCTPWRPERALRAPFDLAAKAPGLVGLRTHDPRAELRAAKLAADHEERVGGVGYPTLVVRATR